MSVESQGALPYGARMRSAPTYADRVLVRDLEIVVEVIQRAKAIQSDLLVAMIQRVSVNCLCTLGE